MEGNGQELGTNRETPTRFRGNMTTRGIITTPCIEPGFS